jgi:radical SAM superfamily enzyme YgiQ (UPF0313 family)
MKIALVNYALPEPDRQQRGTRWWHKSGSRWPATILDRANDGQQYFPWPFLLCYLASMLKDDGHEVDIIDGCVRKWSLEQLDAALASSAPDFIVFETSEQTEHSDPFVLECISRLAPVVLIGPNVNENQPDLLSWAGCRAAVPGEYLTSLVDYFRDPVDGFVPRREVLGIEEMDKLPFAYRDAELYPLYNARFKTSPPGMQGQFVSMWGCQYRCRFCIWIHSYWPRSSQFIKHFSIPRLEAELERLRFNFPQVRSLYDDSDNHHYRGEDALAFAEMMGRQTVPWGILTRADTYMKNGAIDWDTWRAYRDNGLHGVKIGIEGPQEVMNLTNKRLSEEVVREFVPMMQDLGVSIYASFMVGVPGGTAETERDTIRMIEDLAGYRPDLFEYFVSYCDVTRVTPFAGEVEEGARRHDGQAGIETWIDAGAGDFSNASVDPLNLRSTGE